MKRLAVLLLCAVAGFGASRLPVAFEPNRGQAAPGTDFTARGPGFRVSLRSSGADIAAGHSPLATVLAGVHPAARPEAEAPLPGIANYYRFDDPTHAISAIPTYARVRYRGIYPGIDIVYYGDQGRLEYDFILAPGADPRRIRIRYQGAHALHVDPQGDLVVETAGGTLRQHRPVLYQEIAGVRREISGHYVLRGRTVGFQVAAYDRSRPLVIDPVLTWASYFGASGTDTADAVAVDASGNIYQTGSTSSTNGYLDAFVSKVNSSGTTASYTTTVSGTYDDIGHVIAVDTAGNVYVVGETSSPTAFGSLSPHAFISKLDTTGKIVFANAFGGSAGDIAFGVAVDSSNNVYMVGATNSADFPISRGSAQTSLGGGVDGFITKFDANGNGGASTFLGGSGDDHAYAVAIDGAGNAYIAGGTNSTNFPLSDAFQQTNQGQTNALIASISASGSTLLFSSYLGGTGSAGTGGDYANALAASCAAGLVIAGTTASNNFPATTGVVRTAYGGGSSDGFIASIGDLGIPVIAGGGVVNAA